MNVIDAIEQRRSIRAFTPRPVNRDVLLKIVAAANRAPSWADTQPWEVFVAVGEALDRLRERFLSYYEAGVPMVGDIPRPKEWPPGPQQRMMDFVQDRCATLGVVPGDTTHRELSIRRNLEFFGAPAVAFLCLHKDLTPWSYFDMGLYAQSLMLAAMEYSVGSVVAVNFAAYPDIIREELGVPQEYAVMIGIALGYEDPDNIENRCRSIRRPVEQATTFCGF